MAESLRRAFCGVGDKLSVRIRFDAGEGDFPHLVPKKHPTYLNNGGSCPGKAALIHPDHQNNHDVLKIIPSIYLVANDQYKLTFSQYRSEFTAHNRL